MIEVENLSKKYANHLAINDVSFNVPKGEILGFLGPNGAGKSTTMRIITGFLSPTSGKVRVGGLDIMDKYLEARKKIGYLPERPPLYPDMTVISYLDFVGKIKGLKNKNQRKKRLEEILEICWIKDVKDKLISKLSKGYQQRVGLAQAIIHDPEVIILDEPTIGLDPKQINETRKLIKSLGGKHTIILSTHILPEVSMTCDRVLIINKGKVVVEDTPEGLVSQLKGSERIHIQVRGPSDEIKTKIQSIEGIIKVSVDKNKGNEEINSYTIESIKGKDLREKIATTIVNNNWGLLELKPIGVSLEDVFLHVITQEEEVAA